MDMHHTAAFNLHSTAMLAFFLILIFIYVLFLFSLHSALKEVDRERREMEPGMVWLNLIPLVHLVWIFFTVAKIGDGLYAEAQARGMANRGDGTKSLGIAYAVLAVGSFICSFIPFVGLLVSLATFVVWIIYWVKVVGYKNQLKSLD